MRLTCSAITILFLLTLQISFAQLPFSPLDTNFITNTIIVPPSPLKYDILFTGNTDYVFINEGTDSALAKQNMEFTAEQS
ncbi:MAG: hypothetical protein H7Y00_13935 [Fimbriimonadaceae bacterium]|nr:hypothetical protein [Chitinophagales bacterium]